MNGPEWKFERMTDEVTLTDIYLRLSRAAELNRGLYLSAEDVTVLGADGVLAAISELSMGELKERVARRSQKKRGVTNEEP